MLALLPASFRGTLTSVVLGLNTVVVSLSLVLPALLKLLLPVPAVRRTADRALNGLASAWVAINTAWIKAAQPSARWDVQGVDGLHLRGCTWCRATTRAGSTSWCCSASFTAASRF